MIETIYTVRVGTGRYMRMASFRTELARERYTLGYLVMSYEIHRDRSQRPENLPILPIELSDGKQIEWLLKKLDWYTVEYETGILM